MIESLSLGPVLFSAPLALLALIGLPLLWFILRATPPQPRSAELPSLALFEDLAHREETPDQTPWWIILLRLLAITLAILGLARPVWSPPSPEAAEGQGDVLLLMDNDWLAATNWSQRQSAALDVVSGLDLDRGIYLLPTSQSSSAEPLANRLTVQEARTRIRAMRPVAWRPDFAAVTEAVSEFDETEETIWITHAQAGDGHEGLTRQLVDDGPVSVISIPADRLIAIEALSVSTAGPVLSLIRTDDDESRSVTLTAYDENGRSVASVEGQFASGEVTADVEFPLPEDLQARISHFKVLGQSSAAAVWYWEGASRTRRVGLLSGSSSIQPLLTDTYYVKKALAPFSTIFEGTLDELLAEDLGAIVLTDIGQLPEDSLATLSGWVDEGGVLIRFAGPRMAAQSDTLLPVQLRRASRAFDSALSWDSPQKLSDFPDTSPFATIPAPANVVVRRQVLAQPGPELAARTWARLEDGTPLVTADRYGDGRLILFHVTAGPDWSDLPLSGAFVELLRRVTLPSRELGGMTVSAETSLAPRFWLDGFGSVISPAGNARPIQHDELENLHPSAIHPAGVYEGSAVSLPLNAGSGFTPNAMTSWPGGVTLTSVEARTGEALAGLLLAIAAGLLLIDLIVSLILAGKLSLPSRGRSGAAGVIVGLSLVGLSPLPGDAHAQQEAESPQAALNLHFAYVPTGESDLDRRAERGLAGLTDILFRRTTVEPAEPMAVDLETSPLDLYPLILILLPDSGMEISAQAKERLASYLRNGGALIVDTRAGGSVRSSGSFDPRLADLLDGLDLPPLKRVDEDHVLNRSFYILQGFDGRFPDRPLWIEDTTSENRRGDGISTIFISDADFTSAWAIDQRRRPLFSVEGGERNREMAYRTGVNIVMYILTGNYKDDQVHLPSLLERMGEITDGISGESSSGQPSDLRPEGETE